MESEPSVGPLPDAGLPVTPSLAPRFILFRALIIARNASMHASVQVSIWWGAAVPTGSSTWGWGGAVSF